MERFDIWLDKADINSLANGLLYRLAAWHFSTAKYIYRNKNGRRSMDAEDQGEDGSLILKIIESIAISPKSAIALVSRYSERARKSNPNATVFGIQELIGRKIISRYARISATSGGITALTGVIPGVGTAIAMLGGGAADMTISMKLQVDMTMCLAAAFGWDLHSEDAKHLSFLIAAGSSLEKFGVEVTGTIASKAGVNMLRQYLKGAALVATKQMFKKIGVTFTRVAAEKMIPFGVGVVVGSSANFLLTSYVGNEAMKWFLIDHSLGNPPSND